MPGKKRREDGRVAKTKKHLWEAMTRLMKRKKLKDITVRELSEEADLNRTTFYMHYRDVPDMLEKVEGEVLSTLQSSGGADPLEAVFKAIGDNREMILALTGPNGDIGFLHSLMQALYHLISPRENDGQDDRAVFTTGGLAAVTWLWLTQADPLKPAEMAARIRTLMPLTA